MIKPTEIETDPKKMAALQAAFKESEHFETMKKDFFAANGISLESEIEEKMPYYEKVYEAELKAKKEFFYPNGKLKPIEEAIPLPPKFIRMIRGWLLTRKVRKTMAKRGLA